MRALALAFVLTAVLLAGCGSAHVDRDAAVIAAGRVALYGHRHIDPGCVHFVDRISSVDDRYASFNGEPATKTAWLGRRCGSYAYDGQMLLQRAADDRWRVIGEASEPFLCSAAPKGVIRDLFGWCLP